jgi:uncharacterized protein (TIGR02099 family)
MKKNLFKKLSYSLLSIALLVVIGLITAHQLVKHYYQNHQSEVSLRLQQEFGFPVTFDKMALSWKGTLSIQKIIVYDSAVPIPFIEIQQMDLFPDLLVLLKERHLQFKSAVLQGLKISIGIEPSDKISLLGLQGESLSTTVDYAAFMQTIHQYDDIKIKEAMIHWTFSKRMIKQRLQGQFQHQRSAKKEWIFLGTQAIEWQLGKEAVAMEVNGYLTPSSTAMGVAFNLSDDVDMAEIEQFYQLALDDPSWLQWIKNAIPKGVITKASFSLNQQDKGLDWQGSLFFKKMHCTYATGWPDISAAQGKISFNQEAVTIELTQGQLMNAPIKSAIAVVGPFRDLKNLNVVVTGKIESTLEKGRLFLAESPLAASISSEMLSKDLQGRMSLQLGLTIPLVEKKPANVNVEVTTRDAEVKIPETPFSLTAIAGVFQWRDGSLIAKDAKAKFLNHPLSLQIETTVQSSKKPVGEKKIVVTATGEFGSADLQKIASFPILNEVQGQSLFTVTWSPNVWRIASDLEGMAVNLPGFMGKKANSRKPIFLQMSEIEKTKKIRVHLDTVDAIFSLNPLRPELNTGSIQLGSKQAVLSTTLGLSIMGEINNFQVEDWEDFLKRYGETKALFPSMRLSVLVRTFKYHALTLKDTLFESDLSTYPVQWHLTGPLIKGLITLNEAKYKIANLIEIRLSYLKLPENGNTDQKLVSFNQTKRPLQFYCEHFQYGTKDFGEVALYLMPQPYGYEIHSLTAETKEAELATSGEWHFVNVPSFTTLQGHLKSTNMGNTLVEMGHATAIRESTGIIEYRLRWMGDPLQLNLKALTGTANLRFDKGRILGVEPGLGRIMGLLNLQSIQRRLQLDFSDLFKKGFVFDSLRGELTFAEGVIKTDQLKIDGPASKIELAGQAIAETKAVDLTLTVKPHMGVGLPLAAAIAAGNPAVGAGVWLIDRLTGSKVKKLSQHLYHVTGTWETPSIQPIEQKNN